ncbi:class I SAM-dependent rRNA methyltransferase [Clostridium sp. JN-1]|uniref:class I SAM-dependent rRNA methyltransferase n=1 Tax=Clostridium sp. JN-1 TaxID=2483110 RepID=UPI000F0B04EE|nr:class I SAM-dependent rRNA methyltransferase [Clostridium sp. JN-1]
MTCKFYLRRGMGRKSENGYPWIYLNEIESYDGEYKNGDIVEVYNFKDKFIGKGCVNNLSKIFIRILTHDINQHIDEGFFRKRLHDAWEYRKKVLIDTSCCRLLFGESDFIPGLIIDKYGNYYVIQFLSLGIDKYKDTIVKILVNDFNASGIYERDDIKVRELEGLDLTKGFLTQPFDTNIQISENGVKYIIDIENDQKTGFFLDQKENRQAIHKVCKNAEVLDCFTHTGSFALNAGIAGAKSVLGVDISRQSIECAKRNAELNGLSDIVKFECHNAFDILHTWAKQGKKYDVVILDPPAFTKSKSTISNAIRGYKEINLRGMEMIRPGGFLVTCSCSHSMSADLLKNVILAAAKDNKRFLRQVEFRTQSADHPILCYFNESYYLKFYIFQIM